MLRKALPLLALCMLLFLGVACADAPFSVSLPETVRGYTPGEIRIASPAAGEAELKLYDLLDNLWLTRRERISAGENRLPWDGLGENAERLFAGPYRFEAVLRAEDGTEYTAAAKFSISGTTPSLVYALPSSGTLYLDKSEKWFTECFVSAECSVVMEVWDGKGKKVFSKEAKIVNPDGESVGWSGALQGKKQISPGDYTVIFRSKPNPDYQASFPLRVEETNPLSREVKETGPVVPERGMSDGEIWEIMRKPSVVINAKGSRLRFNLYAAPRSARVAGTLCAATQALEVLGFDGDWAHVAAWNHQDGKKVDGYILTRQLTVVTVNGSYGILIDKRDQTLTVYENGKRIGTVPVSTGKPVPGDPWRETPAGAFLTDVHFGSSFVQDEYRYEYPLRYDGLNFIHSVGYTRQGRVRDYSKNLPLLGQKASHGCVRVSPFIGEESPVNMYWLWLRMPYHTRVIILDD